MVDLLGPNSTNAVTTRPDESAVTYGVADTWWKDCASSDPSTGTALRAFHFNKLIAQLRRVIRYFGIAEDNTDDDMLRKSIERAVLLGRGWRSYSRVAGVGYAPVTSSFTVPDGITRIYGRCWGGGGGGGGAGLNNFGQGAGAGGFAGDVMVVTPGMVIPITAGGAGQGGTNSGTDGGNGGTSSFGSFMAATGGIGGLGNMNSRPPGFQIPDGGNGSGSGMLCLPGSTGGVPLGSAFPAPGITGGDGGAAPFSGAGGVASANQAGARATSPGCGGAGGSANYYNGGSGNAGGDGAPGLVELFY